MYDTIRIRVREMPMENEPRYQQVTVRTCSTSALRAACKRLLCPLPEMRNGRAGSYYTTEYLGSIAQRETARYRCPKLTLKSPLRLSEEVPS
jgi:hypothetical protein